MDAARRRRLWAWGALVAVSIAGLVPFLRKGTSELPVYTRGAARMAAREEIYRPSERKPFTYPPAFALPFLPFLAIPERLHRAAWWFVNVAILVRIVLALRTVAVVPFAEVRSRAVLFWILVAALSGRHVLETLANQSHDLLVALCVVQCALDWSRGREARAGIAAGVGAALKATPLLLLLPFALKRRGKALVAAVLALAVATLVPDLLFPRDDGRLWATAFVRTALEGVGPGAPADHARQWSAGSRMNQSLAGTLHRILEGSAAAFPAILAAQFSVLLFVAARARRPAGGARLGEVGLVACGMVLVSPMSSKSNFCVLIVPAAYAAARLLRGPRDPVSRALLLGSAALGAFSSSSLVGRAIASRLLDAGAVTWSALLLLLAVGRGLATEERGDGALPPEPPPVPAAGPPSVSLPR